MQTIYLDISNKGVVPTIYAKQGDVGRKFQVVLTDSGLPYIPVGGSAFSVWYSGASGDGNYTEVGDKSAFSVSGNKVTVEMISQMLSNDGEGVLSFVFNDPNGNQISTWNIPYICEYVPGADSEEAKAYYTAFSHAVENLPYPDASLSTSGKAADAAATGKALEGKAPAGYGLGGQAKEISDCHVAESGFYRWDVGCANAPFEFATMISVNRYGSGSSNRLALCGGGLYQGCIAHKVAEEEWEYVNPPMELNKEYRTTKRHNGKPVYAKAVTCGALGHNTADDVPNGISNIDAVWVTGGYWRDATTKWSLPYFGGADDNQVLVSAYGGNIHRVHKGSVYNIVEMVVNLEYTKTT